MGKNIWKRKIAKSHVTIPEISEKLNISTEKLEEIVEGKRPMPRKYVNDFLKITEDKQGVKFNQMEIKQWFTTTDLRGKRKEFNLTMKEMADKLKIGYSTVSKYETSPYHASVALMAKVYNFFNDELNVEIEKEHVQEERNIKEEKQYYPNMTDMWDKTLKENEELKDIIRAFAKLINRS